MVDTATPGPWATCICAGLVPPASEQPRTPRVQDLLRQNGPPLEFELAEFRAVVNNSASIICDLDKQIARAQEVLASLVRARAQAEVHLADAKALIHPLRSLPTEILSEIFRLCAPSWDQAFLHGHDSLDHRYSPWTLSQVCRKWRDLTLSLPSLWMYFELDFETHARMSARQTAYRAGLYLSRSANLPFDLYIMDADELDVQSNIPHAITTLLELNIHRCRRLRVEGSLSPLRCFPGSLFSSLAFIQILETRQSNLGMTRPSPAYFPCLRTMDAASWSISDWVHFPWSRITTFTGWDDFETSGWNSLRLMTDLEDLTASIADTQEPVSRIRLSKLVSLEVQESEGIAGTNCLRKFVSALDTPMLSKLNLCFWRQGGLRTQYPDSHPSLQNLTTLSINGEDMSQHGNASSLLQFLSQTPNVEDFVLSDKQMTADFFAGLTLWGGPEDRLPRLRVLDIGNCMLHGALSREPQPIWQMSKSRYGSTHNWTTCLETLIVPFQVFTEENDDWVSIRSSTILSVQYYVECGEVAN